MVAVRLLFSGNMIDGPELALFRNELTQRYACREVFLTGSGRLAITVFLNALARKFPAISRNVVIPFYVCPSVPEAVAQAGFTPQFVSVRKDLTIDVGEAFTTVLKSAGVVIVPHIYGFPARISELLEKVHLVNPSVVVIDDAASGFDIDIPEGRLGSFGDAGILSFSQGKLLNATGGGALILHNREMSENVVAELQKIPFLNLKGKLYDLVKVLWFYGCHRFADTFSYWLGKVFSGRWLTYGNSCRMSNFDAALALAGLSNVETIHSRRAAIIAHYYAALSGKRGVFFPQPLVSGYPPVNRFYFGLDSASLRLNDNGEIKKHNPLYLFAREHGVKLFYPYLPLPKYFSEYGNLWCKEKWILSLLGLPIDFRRPLAWHDRVIDVIQCYIEKENARDRGE